jgi:hypothetical protein
MRDISDKIDRGNQNTHFMFNSILSENHTVYETMLKMWWAKGATDDVTKWRIRVGLLVKRGYMHARTHKYVLLIAFPQQQ